LVDGESIIKVLGPSYSWNILSTDLVLVGLHVTTTLVFSIVGGEIKSEDSSSIDVELGNKVRILTRTPSYIRKLVSFPSN
jgi:hypothetical protein